MITFLSILQFITAILLIIIVLLQQRGTGLSGLFGGSGDVYKTKRGIERVLFISTIVLVVLFLGSGLAILLF